MLESRRIWSIHRARGLAGRRLQSGPGGRPTDRSMRLRCAMCAGTSFSSRAMCQITDMRRAARISPKGVRPVRACTSTLLTKSNQWIPSIWCRHFTWKASKAPFIATQLTQLDIELSWVELCRGLYAIMSVDRRVQVSAAYINTDKTRAS